MITLLLWTQLLYSYLVAPYYNYLIEGTQEAFASGQYDVAAKKAWNAYNVLPTPEAYIFCLFSYYQIKAWERINSLPLPSIDKCTKKEWAYIQLIKGVAAYEDGQQAVAIEHFRQALIAYPLPDAAYNLELLLRKQSIPIPQQTERPTSSNPQISNFKQILQSIQNNEKHRIQRRKGKQQDAENIEW
jgi:tetratricopeptide (TPR) repeat protein